VTTTDCASGDPLSVISFSEAYRSETGRDPFACRTLRFGPANWIGLLLVILYAFPKLYAVCLNAKAQRMQRSAKWGYRQSVGIFSRCFLSEVLTGTKKSLKSAGRTAEEIKSIRAGNHFDATKRLRTGISEKAETSFSNDERGVDIPPFSSFAFLCGPLRLCVKNT